MSQNTTTQKPKTLNLKDLKARLRAVKYKTRVGKTLAKWLYISTRNELSSVVDIVGILLYEVPRHWGFILREYNGGEDNYTIGEDAKAVLEAWLSWLYDMGMLVGYAIDGEEDFDNYLISLTIDTRCHDMTVFIRIHGDKVESELDYYNNACKKWGRKV